MSISLDLDSRKKIYELIANNPGVNLSTIAELLEMSIPLVDYHTKHMEDSGLISTIKEEGKGFKRYYLKGEMGTRDKKFLGVLRQETPLKIVLFLLEHPYSKHREILDHFELAGSTLSYHLKKLIRCDIVQYFEGSEQKGYLVKNEQEVIHFLIQYKPSKTLKRFKETWADDFHIP